MSVPKTLRRAADLIEEGGWCRHRMYSDRGEHCALGGIVYAVTGKKESSWGAVGYEDLALTQPAVIALAQHINSYDLPLRSHVNHLGTNLVVEWNNFKAAGVEEVVNTLRVVAALHDESSIVEEPRLEASRT